jgi:hypothetical protein
VSQKVTVDIEPRFEVLLTQREAQVIYALLYKLSFEPDTEFGEEASNLASELEEAANSAGIGDDFGNVVLEDLESGDALVVFS